MLTILSSCGLHAISVVLPPQVSVEIIGNRAYELQPIPCSISIISIRSEKVDISSFRYHDKPLKVQFVKDVEPGPKNLYNGDEGAALIVSTYSFTLPPQNKGLYTIDDVHVIVGGFTVSSVPVTYEVIGPEVNTLLTLDAKLLQTGAIYPGQHANFQYRISFQYELELTKEDLPLLSLPSFRNIGAPKIETFAEGTHTIQVITQEAVALQPGHIAVPQSVIEGHSFTQDSLGNKVENPQLLQASAAGFEFDVLPFPLKDQPASFTGAIGFFRYQLSAPTAAVKEYETMNVQLLVSGQGQIDTVTVSPTLLKKYLSNIFEVSDIPPAGTVEDNAKRFIIPMKPLSAGIKEIPPLEFSSFDPSLHCYYTMKTKPVPITVLAAPAPKVENRAPGQQRIVPNQNPIDIYGNEAVDPKMRTYALSVPMQLLIFACFAALIVCVRICVLAWRRTQGAKPAVTSHDLFMQALKQKYNLKLALPLIRRALLLRLYEVKETKTCLSFPEELGTYGVQGDIKKFLSSLDEKIFGGKVSSLTEHMESKEIIDQATELYHRLQTREDREVKI